MPNFDGTGPLKRGRAIGRGQGPCGKEGAYPDCSNCPKRSEEKNSDPSLEQPSEDGEE